jgi:hypothetical protein
LQLHKASNQVTIKATLEAYKKAEPAITWCGNISPLNLTSSNQSTNETVPNTISSGSASSRAAQQKVATNESLWQRHFLSCIFTHNISKL